LVSSRGQVFSIDLTTAVSLSLVTLAVLYMTWSFERLRIGETIYAQSLEDASNRLSEMLVKTKGEPPDWEENPVNATSIGLAEADRVLSPAKVDALGRVGCDAVIHAPVDVTGCMVTLRSPDGRILRRIGEPVGGDSAVTSTRIVSYMNVTTLLEVTVWGYKQEVMLWRRGLF